MNNLSEMRKSAVALVAATASKKISVDKGDFFSKSVTNGSGNCSTGTCGSDHCHT